MENTLKNYLTLDYDELAKLNLEMRTERVSGKDNNYFYEKITSYLKYEKGIKGIAVCFSDIEGKLHMLDYNPAFLVDNYDNLTFDGSSIRGFSAQEQSDLRLKIDWSSFLWVPADIFGAGKALVFAFVYNQEGKPFDADFRTHLYNLTQDLYKKDKILVNASTETEGILLEDVDIEQSFTGNGGFKLVTRGGYFNSLPQDKLRLFIDKVAEALAALGFYNEKDHPEVAPSQFELSYSYTDILQSADRVLLYKLVCRQIAKSMGLTATFLPKPIMKINGNGMHTNISLSQNGKNIFYDSKGVDKLSKLGHKFLTSILYYAKDLCLILNSSVNSYRRLDPAFEAPNEIKSSASDRGAMIRIPFGNEKSARIEVRSVAPDCNPYLVMYSLLKTGMMGVDDKNSAIYNIVHEKREKLPGNIYDAIRYFKKSNHIEKVIGDENLKRYVSLKEDAAGRCAKELGTLVKTGEVRFHHEITNQYLWSDF